MNEENCENCKFYKHEIGMNEDVGRCRKVPPVFVFEPGDMSDKDLKAHECFAWAQPAVCDDGWCGEWKAKA